VYLDIDGEELEKGLWDEGWNLNLLQLDHSLCNLSNIIVLTSGHGIIRE
jgi:hypothetical protein